MADIKFTGNCGSDPDMKFSNSGDAILSFSVAESKSKKLQDGTWETTATQWLRVTVWRELAEFYADRITKGSRVTVYGDFMSREWEQDGVKRTSLDVTAKGIEVHPKRGEQRPSQPAQSASQGWGAPQPQPDPWGQPQGDQAPF